jgi:predicted metal-dependent phosphoesterase TrpH
MASLQSLHGHTKVSDGKMDYTEYLESAQSHNLSAVAFTDHDALPNQQAQSLLQTLKNTPVKWIVGVELSSGLPREIAHKPFAGLHIVGLFIDPNNRNLLDHCQRLQQDRISRMEKIVTKLTELGFKISAQDCLNASRGESVGRPHIVQAILEYPQNNNLITQLRLEMETAAKNDPQVSKKYQDMVSRGPSQYPYYLFLDEKAFKPAYADYSYWLDLDQTVSLIRQAGGLAILAHYSTAKSQISPANLEEIVAAKRIDGVETVYGLWELGTSLEAEGEQDRRLLKSLVNKYPHLVASGGGDIHSEADFKAFSEHSDYFSDTANMAEIMIAKSRVDTTWSSF